MSAKKTQVDSENITIEFVEVTEEAGAIAFVDIADNVLPIRPDFTQFLDTTKPIGAITARVCDKHALLNGRVETGQERGFGKGSPHLLGYKAAAEVSRAVLLGTVGRAGARKIAELRRTEDHNVAEVMKF